MADNPDLFKLNVSFTEAKDAAARMLAAIELDIAEAVATGDTLREARLQARKQYIANEYTTKAPEIATDNTLLERQLALQRELDQATAAQVGRLKEMTAQLAEQLAVRERLITGTTEGGVIIPQARGGAYGDLAGQQLATAEKLKAQQLATAEAQKVQLTLLDQQVALSDRLAAEATVRAEVEARIADSLKAQDDYAARAYARGATAGVTGRPPSRATRTQIVEATPSVAGAGAAAGAFNADAQALTRYNLALGENTALMAREDIAVTTLSGNLTRLGITQNGASNQMRAHGALTTEFLSALAKGETTVSEFGYQIGATIGKFAGWTAAAAATYGALGAVVELGKGAIDTASSVQQLTRTIDGLDKQKASIAIQDLSAKVNVPVKEAGDAIFAFSRTFHTLDGATTAAGLSLAAFKLDGVAVTDSVKAATAISTQFGVSAQGLKPVFDELAQGQQKFNARISDQIPLLQKSASAVKNAGGNLSDFIKISTIFLRTTQLSGSIGGTAFARSAATFLSPDTTKGQTDRAVLKSLGIDPNQNYTNLIFDALKKATALTPDQRNRLSLAIFGPQLGARTAGFFSGGAALLPPVGRDLSAKGSAGVLQQELDRQLGTATERLHSFINGIQRLGGALGTSGILSAGGFALGGLGAGTDEIRKLVDAFDQLPGPMKTAVEAVVALRLASLALTRTRFGASIGQLPGLRTITQLPGLHPSDSQVRDQALLQGTRASIGELSKSVGQQADNMLKLGQQQSILAARAQAAAADIEKATQAAGEEDAAYAARVAILNETASATQQINVALGRQLIADQANLEATQAVLAQRTALVKGITTKESRGGLSQAERQAAADAAGITTAASTTTAEVGLGGAVATRAAAAKAKLAAALTSSALGDRLLGGAASAETVAAREAAVAAEADVALLDAAKVSARGAVTAIGGFATSLGGLASSLDPMLAALIALPIVLSQIQDAIHRTDAAVKATKAATRAPVTDLAGLRVQAKAYQDAAAKQEATRIHPSGLLGIADDAAGIVLGGGVKPSTILNTGLKLAGQQPGDPAQTKALATAYSKLIASYDTLFQGFKDQGAASAKAAKSGTQLEAEMSANTAHTVAFAKLLAKQDLAGHPIDQFNAVSELVTSLTASTKKIEAAARLSRAEGGKASLGDISKLSDTNAEKLITYLDDYGKVFGENNSALPQAASAIAQLAQRFVHSPTDTSLKAFAAAEQSYVSAVTKNATDLLNAAKLTPSTTTALGDTSQAITGLQQEIAQEKAKFAAQIAKNHDKGAALAAMLKAENLLLDQLGSALATAVSDHLALLSSQEAVTTSAIQGNSPEANIARARSALAGLKANLAYAKSHGDAKTINDLQNSVNTAQTAIIGQVASNALALAQAQGQLTQAAITGLGPGADIARAQAGVSAARTVLAKTISTGGGQVAIITAQAGLDSAIYSLNQAMQSNAQTIEQDAQGLIDANTALAQSQTLDPVQQALDALKGDEAKLKTIKRSDYKSPSEYLAAVKNQQAAVNNDRTKAQQALLSQDQATLQYEYTTQQIGSDQYLKGLEALLKLKKLSLAERQQLETQIYQLGQSTAVDLNVGSIKLPTSYEVRSAIARASHGRLGQVAGGVNANVTSNVKIAIVVNKNADVRKVTDAIGKALDTNVQGIAQAAGLI